MQLYFVDIKFIRVFFDVEFLQKPVQVWMYLDVP